MSSKKCALISILSLLIFSGCSTILHLKPGENFSHSSARVILKNADTIKAIAVCTRGNSLVIRGDSQEEISLPLMEVQKIAVKKRVKGAWQGAGLGFLAVWGAMPFIGAIGAAVEPCEFECGFGPKSPGEGFLVGLILGPILGVIWGVPGGAIIGAIKGADDTYIFSESTVANPPQGDSPHHRDR